MQYSKFTIYQNVVRDVTSAAKAVCNDNLKEKYFDDMNVQYYLGATIVFPIIVLILVLIAVRSCSAQIVGKLKNAQNHSNLAGASLTAIYVMLYVIANDIAALHVYTTNTHEYNHLMVQNSFGIFIAAIIFALNCFLFLYFLVFYFPYLIISVCTEVNDAVDWQIQEFQDESASKLQALKFCKLLLVKDYNLLRNSERMKERMALSDFSFLEKNIMVKTILKMKSLKESLDKLVESDRLFIKEVKEFIQSLEVRIPDINDDTIVYASELSDFMVKLQDELQQLQMRIDVINPKLEGLDHNFIKIVKKLYLGYTFITFYESREEEYTLYTLQMDKFFKYYQKSEESESMLPVLSVLILYRAVKFHCKNIDYHNLHRDIVKMLDDIQNFFIDYRRKLEQLKTRIEQDRSEFCNLKKEFETGMQRMESLNHQIEMLMPVNLNHLLLSARNLKENLSKLSDNTIQQERVRVNHPNDIKMDKLKTLATFPEKKLSKVHDSIKQKKIPSVIVVHELVIKLGIFLQNLDDHPLFQYLKPEYTTVFNEGDEPANLVKSLKEIAHNFRELKKQIFTQYEKMLSLLPFWKTLESLNEMANTFKNSCDNEEEVGEAEGEDSKRLDLLSEVYELSGDYAREINKKNESYFVEDIDRAFQIRCDVLQKTVTDTKNEVDRELERVDCLFEVEEYLQKSINFNIMRQTGRDIIIQDQHLFKDASSASLKCKKHCSNALWCSMFISFSTILGHLKCCKPNISSHFNVWFVASLMLFPFFIITSHTGYILAAWLTEPDKTTSLATLATGIIFFLFIMTRALYMVGKNYNSGLTCSRNTYCAVATRLLCPFIFPILYFFSEIPSNINNSFKDKMSLVSFQRFSMTGFYIAGSCGFFAVGSVALTVSAFVQIPIKTVTLPGYLQNIVQIILILITALVSYKVLNFSETDGTKFLRRLINRYLKDKEKEKVSGASPGHLDHIAIDIETELDGDEYENAGTIAGNVAYSLEHKA